MLLALLLLPVAACDDETKDVSYAYACDEPRCHPETGAGQPVRALDLVVVIDNTLGTVDEEVILQGNVPAFVHALKDSPGGLPDLHMGVITPDLGAAPYNIPGCNTPGGDGGRFLKGPNNSCVNPAGQNYVVDVAPRGCTVERAADGVACTANDCTAAHCEAAAFTGADGVATEPEGLILATDEHGCPRCRNYRNQTLEEVFQCMAITGSSGCGMEQPLEAMRQALLVVPEGNERFLRPAAGLGIFLLMDNDDCSVADTEMFNPEGNINSELGTLSAFRCTEFGIVCDQPWERPMTEETLTYTNCRPREAGDPDNLLFPISGYVDDVREMKPSGLHAVMVIGIDTEGTLVVSLDSNQNPKLAPGCGVPTEGADPTLRLSAFVRSLTSHEEDLDWAISSICATDFSAPLSGWGDRLASFTSARCTGLPLSGCPDPRAALGGAGGALGAAGLTALPERFAAVCEPTCTVLESAGAGTPTEVPPCAAGYAGGHPAEVDPALPVPACFHVVYDPGCA
ncbi:MAG: hypothetical protein CVU65_18875, partial [Deltaproteobacteria bacterium HGW-Deltaproteobacteria-22]